MTLLEQAKSTKSKRPDGVPLTPEVVELTVAFFHGDISLSQYTRTLDCPIGQGYSTAGSILRRAIAGGYMAPLIQGYKNV